MGILGKIFDILSGPRCQRCGTSEGFFPRPFSFNEIKLCDCCFTYKKTGRKENMKLCKTCLEYKKKELDDAGVVYTLMVTEYKTIHRPY